MAFAKSMCWRRFRIHDGRDYGTVALLAAEPDVVEFGTVAPINCLLIETCSNRLHYNKPTLEQAMRMSGCRA